MNPTISFENRIYEIIAKHNHISAKDIREILNISEPALFKHLKKLIFSNRIVKIGKTPKVYYNVNTQLQKAVSTSTGVLKTIVKRFIEKNYLYITSTGDIRFGMDGFEYWTTRTKQAIVKTANDYYLTQTKYNSFKKNSLIDGLPKIKATFPKVFLDRLYYLDFYSIERYGKTKLGQMLLYAKQSQDKKIIKDLSLSIKENILSIIKRFNIDAIGFIPPTVKREVQFMRELEKTLDIRLPQLKIVKVKGQIAIPQKTLSKLIDRIENAQKTIIVAETRKFNNILLIDDAVGSGSTLNETASQIRVKGLCNKNIIGLAITGSLKGFDVISEV
jgi:predicted amidophosphoribosyltransferase